MCSWLSFAIWDFKSVGASCTLTCMSNRGLWWSVSDKVLEELKGTTRGSKVDMNVDRLWVSCLAGPAINNVARTKCCRRFIDHSNYPGCLRTRDVEDPPREKNERKLCSEKHGYFLLETSSNDSKGSSQPLKLWEEDFWWSQANVAFLNGFNGIVEFGCSTCGLSVSSVITNMLANLELRGFNKTSLLLQFWRFDD